jgi:hypothetical protein
LKYHITIWTDDGFKREFDTHIWPFELALKPPSKDDPPYAGIMIPVYDGPKSRVQIIDAGGVTWFFNWNHVLGGTVQEIKGESDEKS